jgi:hypothetical protein
MSDVSAKQKHPGSTHKISRHKNRNADVQTWKSLGSKMCSRPSPPSGYEGRTGTKPSEGRKGSNMKQIDSHFRTPCNRFNLVGLATLLVLLLYLDLQERRNFSLTHLKSPSTLSHYCQPLPVPGQKGSACFTVKDHSNGLPQSEKASSKV